MCLCISQLQVLLEYWCLFVCLYLYHCWYSLSTLRYSMEKALRTTNQTVFAAHIYLSDSSAYHNALCSTNDATKTHMAAVCRLHTLCLIDIFVGAMPASNKEDINDDVKHYCALLYIKI